MYKLFIKIIGTLLLTLMLVVTVMSQGGRQGGRYGGGRYDLNTVTTMVGEVVRIDQETSRRGKGLHLVIKTENEEIAVHLGPVRFIEEEQFTIAVNDRIEIKGSRITLQGAPVIIAAEVKKGDKTLKLRDEMGRPLWRGRYHQR